VLTRQRYLDTITQEGGRVAVLARGDDLSVRVPSCPDWDLAALVSHLGWVHRYVTAWMDAGEPVGRDLVGPVGDDLAAWFTEGLDALVERLDGCDPDAAVSTFVGPGTNWFWLRRMAHENTVHRWDAEDALGMPGPVPSDVALDGVDEFLTGFHLPHRVGKHLAGDGQTLHFHATDGDGEWVVTRSTDGATVERAHQRSDVAARGRGEDLLLFVWGRRGPEVLEVFGDEAQLTVWQEKLNP
jgi:uncharacterized protein (TIGR03083 family)